MRCEKLVIRSSSVVKSVAPSPHSCERLNVSSHTAPTAIVLPIAGAAMFCVSRPLYELPFAEITVTPTRSSRLISAITGSPLTCDSLV